MLWAASALRFSLQPNKQRSYGPKTADGALGISIGSTASRANSTHEDGVETCYSWLPTQSIYSKPAVDSFSSFTSESAQSPQCKAIPYHCAVRLWSECLGIDDTHIQQNRRGLFSDVLGGEPRNSGIGTTFRPDNEALDSAGGGKSVTVSLGHNRKPLIIPEFSWPLLVQDIIPFGHNLDLALQDLQRAQSALEALEVYHRTDQQLLFCAPYSSIRTDGVSQIARRVLQVLVGLCCRAQVPYVQAMLHLVLKLCHLRPCPLSSIPFAVELCEKWVRLACPHILTIQPTRGIDDTGGQEAVAECLKSDPSVDSRRSIINRDGDALSTGSGSMRQRLCFLLHDLLQFHCPKAAFVIDRTLLTVFWSSSFFDSLLAEKFCDAKVWLYVWCRLLLLYRQRIARSHSKTNCSAVQETDIGPSNPGSSARLSPMYPEALFFFLATIERLYCVFACHPVSVRGDKLIQSLIGPVPYPDIWEDVRTALSLNKSNNMKMPLPRHPYCSLPSSANDVAPNFGAWEFAALSTRDNFLISISRQITSDLPWNTFSVSHDPEWIYRMRNMCVETPSLVLQGLLNIDTTCIGGSQEFCAFSTGHFFALQCKHLHEITHIRQTQLWEDSGGYFSHVTRQLSCGETLPECTVRIHATRKTGELSSTSAELVEPDRPAGILFLLPLSPSRYSRFLVDMMNQLPSCWNGTSTSSLFHQLQCEPYSVVLVTPIVPGSAASISSRLNGVAFIPYTNTSQSTGNVAQLFVSTDLANTIEMLKLTRNSRTSVLIVNYPVGTGSTSCLTGPPKSKNVAGYHQGTFHSIESCIEDGVIQVTASPAVSEEGYWSRLNPDNLGHPVVLLHVRLMEKGIQRVSVCSSPAVITSLSAVWADRFHADAQTMSNAAVYGSLVPLQGVCSGILTSKEGESQRLQESIITNASQDPYHIPTQNAAPSNASVATFFQRLLTTPLRWTHPRIPRSELASSALATPSWSFPKMESSKIDEPGCKYTVIGPLLGTSTGALKATLQLPDDTAQVQYSNTPPKGLEPVASGTLDIRFTRRKTGRPSNSCNLAPTATSGSYSGRRTVGRSFTSTETGSTVNTIAGCPENKRCSSQQRVETIQDTTWVEWLFQPIFSSKEEERKGELDMKMNPVINCVMENDSLNTKQAAEKLSDSDHLTNSINVPGHVTLNHFKAVTNPQLLPPRQSLHPSLSHLDVGSTILKPEASYSVDSLPFKCSETSAPSEMEPGISKADDGISCLVSTEATSQAHSVRFSCLESKNHISVRMKSCLKGINISKRFIPLAASRHRAKKGLYGRTFRHSQSVFYPSRFNVRRRLLAENCEFKLGSDLSQAWNIRNRKPPVRENQYRVSRTRSTFSTASANTATATAARVLSLPLQRPFTWRPRRHHVAHQRFHPCVCGSKKVTQHEGSILDNWVTVKATTRHRIAFKDKKLQIACLERTSIAKSAKEAVMTRNDPRCVSQQQITLSTLFSSNYAPPHVGVHFVRMRRSPFREAKDVAVQEGPRARVAITPDANSVSERVVEIGISDSFPSQLGTQEDLIPKEMKQRHIVLPSHVSYLVKSHNRRIVKRTVPGLCSSRCSTCSTPRKIVLTASRCQGVVSTGSASSCIKTSEASSRPLSTTCIAPCLSPLRCPVFCRNNQRRKHLTQRPTLKLFKTFQISKQRDLLTPRSLKGTTRLQPPTPKCSNKRAVPKLAMRLPDNLILKSNTHGDVPDTGTRLTHLPNSTTAKLEEQTEMLSISSIWDKKAPDVILPSPCHLPTVLREKSVWRKSVYKATSLNAKGCSRIRPVGRRRKAQLLKGKQTTFDSTLCRHFTT